MKKLYLLLALLALLFVMPSCETEDETEVTVITGTISTPITWKAGETWVVEGSVYLEADLIIEPGTTVEFKKDAVVYVGYSAPASITALGTADKPIVFRGYEGQTWKGIELYAHNSATKSAFTYCTFKQLGGDYALLIYGTKAKLDHCSFTECAKSAIHVLGGGDFNGFTNNTLQDCGAFLMEIDADVAGSLGTTNTFTATGNKGVRISGSRNVTRAATWSSIGAPYVIANEQYIQVDADLTIAAGTTVLFEPHSMLEVGYSEYASLKAVGTAQAPITFTSASANPQPGDWYGIQFYSKNSSTTSELTFCTIEYAGTQSYPALFIGDTQVKLNDCTVAKGQYYGVEVDGNAKFTQCMRNTIKEFGNHPMRVDVNAVYTIDASNTILSDGNFGVYIPNYDLTGTVTWNKHEVPYFVEFIRFNNNAVLTIAPGTTVKFMAEGYFEVGYDAYGKLIAEGTANDPITFTSAASSPSAGDWGGLQFYSQTSAGTKLNNCLVAYAGYPGYDTGAIYINECGSAISLANTQIAHSNACDVYVYYSATPAMVNVTNHNGEQANVCVVN